MESTVKERIRLILKEKSCNPTQLSIQYSVNQKTLNNQINGCTHLSLSTILLVLDKFKDLSSEWRIRGKGEMLIPESSNSVNEELISLRAENKLLRELQGLEERDKSENKTA